MAEGAIVFRWGPSVRGRENAALQVFSESAAYFDDLEKNHRIHGHQPYISMNRDGGMWILQGDTQELAALREEPEFQRLILRVHQFVEDYSAEMCMGGSVVELEEPMTRFAEVTAELG
jgi:hypothetical protein